jgi:deoxyribodipyrimidine photo-lyase
MIKVPSLRTRDLNENSVNENGEFVLYWMTACRRLTSNFALDRAIEWARRLNRPLLILEALRCDYPWASRRLHVFVIQGMHDNQQLAAETGHAYFPYVEPSWGHGSGLMENLAARAAVIVTDDFPCFFLPRMTAAVARRVPVLMEAVDSNGLFPMRAADQIFPTAHAFRRYLQKHLAAHLLEFPEANPLADPRTPRLAELPQDLVERWAPASPALLHRNASAIDQLPVNHDVREAIMRGGSTAASTRLNEFLDRRLARYAEERNQPDNDASSGLSPYLHFGHISVHEIFSALAAREGWSTDHLADAKQTRGSRHGWWGMSETAESFLDELVTWRELGFNMCWQRRDYDQYESLPDWAQQTLEEHARDPRPELYSLEKMETARTSDRLWNAAQNQLVTEGRMHNYLRMLWGKKILQWSATPRDALATMIELNNKYAVDGRNPNSYSGIFWVLGRYDRAWGPERPIFGKIRYMTSENTARKLKLAEYLQTYAPEPRGRLF